MRRPEISSLLLLALPGLAGCPSLAHQASTDGDAGAADAGDDHVRDSSALVCPPGVGDLSVEEGKQQACGGECEMATCGLEECEPKPVLQGHAKLSAIAVHDGFLYWANADEHSLRRRALDGGDERVLLETHGLVRSLTIHGERVFWTESGIDEWSTDESGVLSAPIEGGPVTRLADGGYPEALAVDDQAIYWANFEDGIKRLEHRAGRVQGTPQLFDGWVNAVGLSLFDGTLFWTQMNLDNSLRSHALGSGRVALLACNQQWPRSLVVDEQGIYWLASHLVESGGRLMVMAHGEGVPRVLLELDAPETASLVGDDDALYWIEGTTSVMRMRK